MTADDSASLTIPTWVPELVAQAARTLRAHYLKSNSISHNVILERLIADERMRRVWKELSRHRREQHQPTDAFLRSSELLKQDAAMTSLFYFALNLAVNAPAVITRKELETVRSETLHRVAALRAAADEIRLYGPSQAAAAKVNDDIARHLEEPLPRMEASRLVVERDTGDAQARCFSILFTGYCRQVFGSPLYGTTATVASVALGREITARAVREWCEFAPCG
jgi:hypothetical protein